MKSTDKKIHEKWLFYNIQYYYYFDKCIKEINSDFYIILCIFGPFWHVFLWSISYCLSILIRSFRSFFSVGWIMFWSSFIIFFYITRIYCVLIAFHVTHCICLSCMTSICFLDWIISYLSCDCGKTRFTKIQDIVQL